MIRKNTIIFIVTVALLAGCFISGCNTSLSPSDTATVTALNTLTPDVTHSLPNATPNPTDTPTLTPTTVSSTDESGSSPLQATMPKPLSGWERYEPSSFQDLFEQYTPSLSEEEIGLFLNVYEIPFRARVVYTGASRKIAPSRSNFVSIWITTFGMDEQYPELFETELLFREGTEEYWLPVQSQLIPQLEQQLQPGDEVIVYVLWLGADIRTEEIEWMFYVNEYHRR